jgi:DNA-binding MarR family transcriptional regulator
MIERSDIFPQFETLILPWLGRANKALHFHLADVLSSSGITLTRQQIILLRVLTKRNGIPQNDLAFITDRDKTSLTRLITHMEVKDLVTRKVCEEDKRINKIFITKRGLEKAKIAFPIIIREIIKSQRDIDPQDLETTLIVLKKIINNTNCKEQFAHN